MRPLLFLTLFLVNTLCFANDKSLNLYNWSNYMSTDVIHQFEKETGIQVHYTAYDSNETLYAKLKAAPYSGYDIIVPSSDYVERMRKENMLHSLDLSALPNLQYLNPSLLNKPFDPHNHYSVPYFWGSIAIMVNDRYHNPKDFKEWSDLWKKQYRNQLLLLNDMHDVFAMALAALGYSINDRNPEHIKQAYLKLKQLTPNIKLFNSDAVENIYVDEDATLGMSWSDHAYLSQQDNPHLHYVYPKPHFPLWIDSLAVPKNAPHFHNAMRFINFLMRPDIAAKLLLDEGGSSPNLAAIKQLPHAMQQSTTMNPSADIVQYGEVESDLGAADPIYQKYWLLLKLAS